MSHDQVNIHISVGNSKPIRGTLNPDTQKIEWKEGAPSKNIEAKAQEWLLSRGKYDLAKAKKEMSFLGGGKGKEEKGGGGRLGEAANALVIVATLADIVSDAIQRSRINGMEGTTGFHLDLAGNIVVTNLQKFGDTFGAGAAIEFHVMTFVLGDDGWTDSLGQHLIQNADGTFCLLEHTA